MKRPSFIRPLAWVASSKKDLKKLPERVQNAFGYSLYLAQLGKKSDHAKVLKGFGSSGVLEAVENNASSTFRAIYTVRFKDLVYVLHVFQKKSKRGKCLKSAGKRWIFAAQYQGAIRAAGSNASTFWALTKRGIATPYQEMEIVRERLKQAEDDFKKMKWGITMDAKKKKKEIEKGSTNVFADLGFPNPW